MYHLGQVLEPLPDVQPGDKGRALVSVTRIAMTYILGTDLSLISEDLPISERGRPRIQQIRPIRK